MKHTFMRGRVLNSLIISGCAIALLAFHFPVSGGDNSLRFVQAQINEAGTFEKAQYKAKRKAKQKQKAGKSQKQQTQKAQKGESGAIMKASGGKICPPGQQPLGGARRGGCG